MSEKSIIEKLEAEKLKTLTKYVELLEEKNKIINLVSFSKESIFLEVIVDSLIPWYIDVIDSSMELRIVDIGTGAGIPGIPLAIVLEHSFFSLIDSVKKKIDFVEHAREKLKLKNVESHCERIETFSLKRTEIFDVAVSRAVGEMVVLLEYAAPLLKIGGKLVLYKGLKIGEELKRAKKTCELLGFSDPRIIQYEINEGKKRNLIILKKIRKTPRNFPRKVGMATKKPLIPKFANKLNMSEKMEGSK